MALLTSLRHALLHPGTHFRAGLLWTGLFAAVAIYVTLETHRSVTPNYRHAGIRWQAGETLYDGHGTGFLYLPSCAAGWSVLARMPELGGELLWRVLILGIYVWGCWRISELLTLERSRPLFPLVSLLSAPLAWSSARNGQATLLMTGCLLLSTHAMAKARNWPAAGWLAAALAVKPLAIVLLLLGFGTRPRLRLPLATCVLAMLAAPLLTQRSGYVAVQYIEWFGMLGTAFGRGDEQCFACLWGMLRVWGLELHPVMRLLAAATTAIATLAVSRRLWTRRPTRTAAIEMLLVASIWILLFNPRTENNTYALIAPVVALLAAVAFLQNRDYQRGTLLLAVLGGMLGSYELGRMVTSPEQAVWLAPLMGLVLAVMELWRLAGTLSNPGTVHPEPFFESAPRPA